MGWPLNGQYKHEYKMMCPSPATLSVSTCPKNGIVILGNATQTLPQIVLEEDGGEGERDISA